MTERVKWVRQRVTWEPCGEAIILRPFLWLLAAWLREQRDYLLAEQDRVGASVVQLPA